VEENMDAPRPSLSRDSVCLIQSQTRIIWIPIIFKTKLEKTFHLQFENQFCPFQCYIQHICPCPLWCGYHCEFSPMDLDMDNFFLEKCCQSSFSSKCHKQLTLPILSHWISNSLFSIEFIDIKLKCLGGNKLMVLSSFQFSYFIKFQFC
jgi:hypothetical protein